MDEPTNLGSDEVRYGGGVSRPICSHRMSHAQEQTVEHWAETVIEIVDQVLQERGFDLAQRKRSGIVYKDALQDDPVRRRADTTKARSKLDWRPRWRIEDGIKETVQYFIGLGEEVSGVKKA